MNWTLLLIGFALAVFTGSVLMRLLATIRPEWSSRRKRLTAASALPAVTAAATATGVLLVAASDHGEQMKDLAMAALATIGGGFTLLAWTGGLLGATGRRQRQ